MQRIHFVGIGGIGVSALARYYKSRGWRVTGSDLAPSEITRDLTAEGIRVRYGSKRSYVSQKVKFVVHSPAVPSENPELREARRRRIPILSYPEAVGELTEQYETIAVSGSHGKSTTTALIGLILARAGLDPTVIVGAKLREFGNANFRSGRGRHLVLEADEWNRSFHSYKPTIAVLTNVDAEHLDTYETFAGVVRGFAQYLRNVRPGGTIVANWGDRGVRRVIANNANWFRNNANKIFWYNRGKFQKHPLRIPGAHNQVNAEAAWQTWRVIANNANFSRNNAKRIAEKTFRNYRGAWRRLERLQIANRPVKPRPGASKSQIARAILYTDYAHHPTEIRATLQALRERHPEKRIIAVFQPHHADRLARLFKEFQTAFDGADEAIILPAYRVAGRERGVLDRDSVALVRAIRKPSVQFARNVSQAFSILEPMLRERIVVVCMSAGDLDAAVRQFAAKAR